MARAGARMIRGPHPMARTHKALAAGLVAVTALLSSDGWLRGERAFAKADYAAAAAAFAEAIEQEGDRAPIEWRYDFALASYAAGSLDAALDSASRVAQQADGRLRQEALHLLGSIEWKRAEAIAAMAMQVEAEPFLFDQAIERVARARASWVDAAIGDDAAPESVRNAERALQRLEQLREQKAEKDRQRKAAGAKQKPMAVPDGKDSGEEKQGGNKDGEKDAQDNPLAPLQQELSREQVDRMFEKLEQRDREKLQLRRSLRAQRSTSAERDW